MVIPTVKDSLTQSVGFPPHFWWTTRAIRRWISIVGSVDFVLASLFIEEKPGKVKLPSSLFQRLFHCYSAARSTCLGVLWG